MKTSVVIGGTIVVALSVIARYLNQSRKAKLSKLKLYVYDHCPYCTRVRCILGLKNVPYELVFLEYANAETPIALIGKKAAPIIQLENGNAFGESSDIIKFVDETKNGSAILQPSTNKFKDWISDAMPVLNKLYLPRFAYSPLPEMARFSSREYFINKKEKAFGDFDVLLSETINITKQVEPKLKELAEMMYSNESVNELLGYDDLELFSVLKGLTIVKEVHLPEKIQHYLETMASKCDIKLYTQMAI